MRTEVRLPDVGAEPVVLSVWFAEAGEAVFEGERLVEVLAGGATFDVAAPVSGTLVEQCAFPADRVTAGRILGYLASDAD